MTDFGIEGFDPRRIRSERAFWIYVIGSVLAHAGLVAWLVTANFNLPSATPAILVRLVNPGADAGGGNGEPAGADLGGGPAQPAAAALTAPAPVLAARAAPPLPTVSPVKEETATPVAPEPSAPEPAAPVAAPATDPETAGADGAVPDALPSGPGGPGDGPGNGPGGPGGPGDGTGPVGPGNGGAGTARIGLPLSYTNDMLSRIKRNRSYPDVCRANHVEGTARVRVIINPDGSVAEVKLAHTSGSEALDQAGLAAIKRTTFAPFPPGLDLPPQRITVPVNFSLND